MNAYAGSYASAYSSSCGVMASGCCCASWSLPANSTWPLRVDWTPFEMSIPGYQLTKILSAEIVNMDGSALAEDACISIVSGLTPDPDPPSQPGWTTIINKGGIAVTETLIKAGECDTGNCFKLNMKAAFTDCSGKQVEQPLCVTITVTC